MRLEYTTIAIQAAITRERETLEAAYERLPDVAQFWAMTDLAQSSNFRLLKGPKEGYVRAETFFALVRDVVAPCGDVHLLKEIGDATFLTSKGLRPLLECAVLMDQITSQVAAIAGTDEVPFAVRTAIGFGTAKRIVRHQEDFLGHAIDRLARIMGVRSKTASIFLDDEAYRTSGEIIPEYEEFLKVSESMLLPAELTKGMIHSVYYREIQVDRKKLIACEKNFIPWRDRFKQEEVNANEVRSVKKRQRPTA